MQQKISLHWIADMYLIFATLVALQLLSSTTSRSIHTDNGDKISTGHIAKLLLPLLNSENAKDDFKVRLVPYKDYSKDDKERRKINHTVEPTKRKVKKDLPVAIIIAEQNHKHQNKKLKSKDNVVYNRINDNSADSDEKSSVEVDNSDVDVSYSLEDNGKAHPKIHGYSLKSLKSLLGKLLKNVKRKTLHKKPNHMKHEDKNETDEDESVTAEDNDNSMTDENDSATDENDSVIEQSDSVTDESDSVTDENNSVTDENDSLTDENESVTNENNSVTNENNSVTDIDDSKSNDVFTIESDSKDEESNSSQSSVTSEDHSDSGDEDSDNISYSSSARDETNKKNENSSDFFDEYSSSASDISTSSVENKIENKQQLESSESANDDDNITNSHDSNSESKSDSSDYKKEDITKENVTHESDYDVLNDEIFALLKGGLEKDFSAPSVEFENDDIVDKSIFDDSNIDDSVKGLKYIPVEQLSNEAREDADKQLHYIYKPPYHPYFDYGSNGNSNDDSSVSNEENKHKNHKPKHKKHVVHNTDSNDKSIESNEEKSFLSTNDGKKNAKRKKCLKEKHDVAKEVKKLKKQVKWKLHDIINKLKRRKDSSETIGKKINIAFNFST